MIKFSFLILSLYCKDWLWSITIWTNIRAKKIDHEKICRHPFWTILAQYTWHSNLASFFYLNILSEQRYALSRVHLSISSLSTVFPTKPPTDLKNLLILVLMIWSKGMFEWRLPTRSFRCSFLSSQLIIHCMTKGPEWVQEVVPTRHAKGLYPPMQVLCRK